MTMEFVLIYSLFFGILQLVQAHNGPILHHSTFLIRYLSLEFDLNISEYLAKEQFDQIAFCTK